MSETYADILKRQWSDVPKVKVLPTGTYRLKGKNATYQKAKGEGNPSFLFVYEPKQPMDDVDEAQLAELGANYDLANNRVFVRFWYETSRDLDAIRDHLAKHGIDVENTSIEDSMKAFKGSEVMAYLDRKTFTDNAGEQKEDNEAKTFAPVA